MPRSSWSASRHALWRGPWGSTRCSLACPLLPRRCCPGQSSFCQEDDANLDGHGDGVFSRKRPRGWTRPGEFGFQAPTHVWPDPFGLHPPNNRPISPSASSPAATTFCPRAATSFTCPACTRPAKVGSKADYSARWCTIDVVLAGCTLYPLHHRTCLLASPYRRCSVARVVCFEPLYVVRRRHQRPG